MTDRLSVADRLAAIEAAVRAQPAQLSAEHYDPAPDEHILTAIGELIEESAAHMKQMLDESFARADVQRAELEALRAARR